MGKFQREFEVPFDQVSAPENRQLLVVQASSSGANGGDFARITLNGFEVEVEVNLDGHHRGLHIVVLNPRSCLVEWAQAYDTYQSSEELDKFIDAGLPIGHIVIAACKDECRKHLSKQAQLWFATMGSSEIWKLGYRCGFAFIGVYGKQEANEQRAVLTADEVQAT